MTTVKRGRARECRMRDDALVAVTRWTAQQEGMRVGWQWCLEGIAELPGATA